MYTYRHIGSRPSFIYGLDGRDSLDILASARFLSIETDMWGPHYRVLLANER